MTIRAKDHQIVVPSYLARARKEWKGFEDMFDIVRSTGGVTNEPSELRNPESIHLPHNRSTGPGTDAGSPTPELKGCQRESFLIFRGAAALVAGFYSRPWISLI